MTSQSLSGSKVPASHRDLLRASTAILATIGSGGTPYLSAVAFIYDESRERVKISLNDRRQKTKNLRRDPRATLFIIDPDNSYRTLEIRGSVEIHPDPDFKFAGIAGARYGQDFHRYDEVGDTRSEVVLNPDRIVVTLLPGRPPASWL